VSSWLRFVGAAKAIIGFQGGAPTDAERDTIAREGK
jgi:hypothetical protein